MADQVIRSGLLLPRRFREVRSGEYAPEVAAVESVGPVENQHGETSVSPGSFTTLASLAAEQDTDLLAVQADMASILGARYRIRVRLDGTVVLQEVVHTDHVGILRTFGLRIVSGQTVDVQALHTEATSQDMTGALLYRGA